VCDVTTAWCVCQRCWSVEVHTTARGCCERKVWNLPLVVKGLYRSGLLLD